MEEQKKCLYLDSEFQPASDMLRGCVGDKKSPIFFNCGDNPMRQELPSDLIRTAKIPDIAIQRGFAFYNIDNHNINSLVSSSVVKDPVIKKSNNTYGLEGFQNKDIFITDNGLGESNISKGECPEGYSKDLNTDECIQKCIGCVYRDNMKSREFNEADPCFPNGVYNGLSNEGFIKCTCGKDNKYCSDNFVNNIFTTDGMMVSGKKIIMNTGLTNAIDNLFNFKYL